MTTPRSNPRREFIRHTVDVPLEVRVVPGAPPEAGHGVNVSSGGLAYTAEECLDPGQVVELRIGTVEPPFVAQARVVWCRPEAGRFLVGVEFLDPAQAFQARMVQQVCSIESYRRQVEAEEGRKLSPEEAADEWIGRYAGRFPDSE